MEQALDLHSFLWFIMWTEESGFFVDSSEEVTVSSCVPPQCSLVIDGCIEAISIAKTFPQKKRKIGTKRNNFVIFIRELYYETLKSQWDKPKCNAKSP